MTQSGELGRDCSRKPKFCTKCNKLPLPQLRNTNNLLPKSLSNQFHALFQFVFHSLFMLCGESALQYSHFSRGDFTFAIFSSHGIGEQSALATKMRRSGSLHSSGRPARFPCTRADRRAEARTHTHIKRVGRRQDGLPAKEVPHAFCSVQPAHLPTRTGEVHSPSLSPLAQLSFVDVHYDKLVPCITVNR